MAAGTVSVMAVSEGVYFPLLGTDVTIRVEAIEPALAHAIEQAAVNEIVRVQAVFTVFDPASALSRWRRGELADPPDEVTRLLGTAADWHQASGGAFHPAAGTLRARWLRAEGEAVVPSGEELAVLADDVRSLPYQVGADGSARRTGDTSGVDLNAIAKGYAVDRAIDLAVGLGADGVMVNAGGDLAHRGAGEVMVGIEDPLHPSDNAAPLETVRLRGRAIATSGLARRGFTVGATRYGQVLDPRTARPVDHCASASVLAPTAEAADAMATVAGVLEHAEALAFVDARPDFACLLVTRDGKVLRSARWPAS
ncbi:MAG: FAD:protein FMN transferase [Actinomycetales bacterium]